MTRLKKLLFGGFLLAPLLFGQFDTAEVLGTVRDHTGAVVPKADVTLLNQDTGIRSKASTDENGNYNFFNVKIGRYTITVEAKGFSRFNTTDVGVNVNARQRVDATLQVGAMTESIEVTGAAAALQTDSSEHGQVINTQQIVDLPLNGRNFTDLALLATNVHKSPVADTREGSFNVNGMRSTYNNFLLDGMDNNAYSTSNPGILQPGGAALARRHRRIQGGDQQLQRGVRPRRRRRGQHRDALGNQSSCTARCTSFSATPASTRWASSSRRAASNPRCRGTSTG